MWTLPLRLLSCLRVKAVYYLFNMFNSGFPYLWLLITPQCGVKNKNKHGGLFCPVLDLCPYHRSQ